MGGRKWTKEDDIFLSFNVGLMNVLSLANALNRSESSIQCRMSRLGCDDTKALTGQLTLHELSKLLNVDGRVIYRWISDYGLKMKRHSTRTTAKFRFIKPETFWKWAEQHKVLINFSKIEPNTIVPEPDWVEIERRRDAKEIPNRQRAMWDVKQDEQLIWLYKMGYSNAEIGIKMGRSEKAILRKISRMKVKGRISHDKIMIRWTDEEINFLNESLAKGMTPREIAYELGREVEHIWSKMYRMRQA